MPFYHKLGKIPHKRHTAFRKKDGNIHYEELFGTVGFDGMSSLLYHLERPTQVKEIGKSYSVYPDIAVEKNLKSYLLKGLESPQLDDHLKSRISIMINNDLNILLSAPKNLEQDYFYKGFVQDLCRETQPEMDFDDCQRSVIYGMSDRMLSGGGFLTFLMLFAVPIFIIYVVPVRLALRKTWD